MSVTTGAPMSSPIARIAEVDDPRIGARPDHDHLRPMLAREPPELLVVDPLVLFSHAVRDDRVELAGEIQRMPVREVPPVRQVHAEHGLARLEERQVHRHVRLRARVRLNVRVLGAEELFRARNRERLGDVDELAPAVVPTARISLGVLVRENRPRRLQDGTADEVLRRDQLEPVVLTVHLIPDCLRDLRIGVFQRARPR